MRALRGSQNHTPVTSETHSDFDVGKKEKTIILSLILVISGSIFTVISKNNTNY